MKIDKILIDSLLSAAAVSSRLRQNYDLRTSPDDSSQRMLNALLPGTEVPVHRHRTTTECVFIIKGRAEEVFYDDSGVETGRIVLDASSYADRGCVVPKGVWHTIVVNEPAVIFEAKDGAYIPMTEDDILKHDPK